MTQSEMNPLQLKSVIGFAGKVKGSLILHNDDEHIFQALGSTVVVKHLLRNEQYFLQCGSSRTSVSCMKLSKDGKLLATGQETNSGFPAAVWIWDLSTRKVLHKFNLYKTKIAAISFSPSNNYIATLGGEDDNNLVLWDIKTGDAICGSPAGSGNDTALCCSFSNTNDNTLITAGKYNFRIWQFDKAARKIRPTDCKLGSLKRIFNCLTITDDDETIYAGTQSGDILQISLKHTLFQEKGPKNSKNTFSMGVQTIVLTKDNKHIICGTGNGVIALLNRVNLNIVKKLQFESNNNSNQKNNSNSNILRKKKNGVNIHPSITSIVLNKSGDHFFVGTSKSTMYLVSIKDFDYELRTSAHYNRINDVAFPPNYNDLFVTAGVNDIRVWNIANQNELLRINVPNLECLCVLISNDGKSIISGWNDGKVRVFYPETGRLMYTIHDCHLNGVTTICITDNGDKLITGGNDSLVRVWSINKCPDTNKITTKMLSSLREHQNAISYISINQDNTEFISSSADGSCVIWDLQKCSRKNAMFATTQFSSIIYHPDQSQLLTTGSDRQISYWDATDLSTIRIIEGADDGVINKLAINNDGTKFVSVGEDRFVKVWYYDEGYIHSIGVAHSGNIKSCKISPNNKYIVSVGDEGAICIWKMPQNDNNNNNDNDKENNQ